MIILKYIDSENEYNIEFTKISAHVVQIMGKIPFNDTGFILSRRDKNDNWMYSNYTTLFRKIEGGMQFSDDGSVYDQTLELNPTPDMNTYIPTLKEMQELKVAEMETAQQKAIQTGIDVVLTDGTTEHFTLHEKDQISLMGLQTRVAQGEENIQWHTSDQSEHCKYYSNADMMRIITAAMQYVTFHVTYFRDLRIYIRNMVTKEEVEAVTYGMEIPQNYRSQPLKDMLTEMV